MAFIKTSPLYVESLPSKLIHELEKLPLLPIPEFEKHTILLLSDKTLRDLFSAHWNSRNQACGALMSIFAQPESNRDSTKWVYLLGILQREHQYMNTIADFYNRVHAK